MRRAVPAALLVVAAAGCGGDDAGVLAKAEEHLANLREATVELELTASAGDGAPVGFRVEGPFSLESDGDLPVLDLTYTRLLGEDEQVVRVVSDGERVVVEQDGEEVEVPAGELDALRLGDGETAGLDELDLDDWVDEPEIREDGGTTTVTGELDEAALLHDLNRIVAEVAGAEGVSELADDTAERLEELVRSSSIEIVTTGDDHRLRSLEATIDFGREVPPALEEALGPYAAARVRLRLALS